MSFSYSKLDYSIATDGSNYFLDANIWLKILNPKIKSSYKDKAYRSFFDSIINNSKTKIVVPSLVLSEVINRILREVHMGKYISKIKRTDSSFVPTADFYKSDFRKTEDFRIAYNLVCDEIKNYHSSITLINDGLGSDFKFKHILKDPPSGLDFNDYYYYNICKKNNYILITDDKDFWVEDVVIYTQSETLYNRFISLKVGENNILK